MVANTWYFVKTFTLLILLGQKFYPENAYITTIVSLRKVYKCMKITKFTTEECNYFIKITFGQQILAPDISENNFVLHNFSCATQIFRNVSSGQFFPFSNIYFYKFVVMLVHDRTNCHLHISESRRGDVKDFAIFRESLPSRVDWLASLI